MTLLTRRRVLSGLVAAPIVVATPGLLMKVKAVREDWLPCYGQEVSRATYRALFEAIGYTFGGEGPVFRLPDMSGRIRGCFITAHGVTDAWVLERNDIATRDQPNGIPAGFVSPIFQRVPA